MRCLGLPRCQQAHGHLTAASVSLCDQHRSRTLHRLRCQSSSKLVLRETAGSRTTTYTLTSHTEGPSTLHHTTTSSTVTDSGSDADEQQQLLSQQQDAAASPMAGLTARLHELYLPAGFPASVTPDYLPYQLSTIPAHVTGWLSHSLVTSSLLKAVGINAGPAGTAAATAAIKWIVKDGIGALGRFFVGGRLGREFDDDPRYWRMVAEAVATVGLALEIATSIYPSQFLLLASTGNFAKAVGKGMGKPVFRVVQTHFAASGNVGAVATKEEVWEVSAQLAGYGASVLLLQALQGSGDWQTVVGTWAAIQGVHVGLRYLALSQLSFNHLNSKRAALLTTHHVATGQVLGVQQANAQENMLQPAAAVRPRLRLGVTLQEAWGAPVVQPPSTQQQQQPQHGVHQQQQVQELEAWLQLYEGQGYWLAWREGTAWVVLQEGYTPQVLLQAVWQAAWLQIHDTDKQEQQQQQDQQQQQQHTRGEHSSSRLLQQSLSQAKEQFTHFLEQLRGLGWDTQHVTLQVGQARVSLESEQQAAASSLQGVAAGAGKL